MNSSDPMDTSDPELPRFQSGTSRPQYNTSYVPPPPPRSNAILLPAPPSTSARVSTPAPAPAPTFLPPNLWSLAYITHANHLEIAMGIDQARVAELFAGPPTTENRQPQPQTQPQQHFRLPTPPIQPYDGQPSGLRSFCSQLLNQMQGYEGQVTESEKVRFAYQLLGPGALAKMRSSFRCLEDPTVPAEINTLAEFIAALKQRCQDPGLQERASCLIDNLKQNNMRFHDFITIFEDNMADSSYSHEDKSQWRVMLQRRLSTRLRNALVMVSDAPRDYHEFVAYLREKDAGFYEIQASNTNSAPVRTAPTPTKGPTLSYAIPPPVREPTVSQGGSAMDLDPISRQKGPDGRLTIQAKDARRALGRCLWCNKAGHVATDCPLGSRTVASASTTETSEDLKEELQQ